MHHIECFFFSSCCWMLWIVNLLEEMCNIGWLRTGNPLVDSVAEHQAASEQAYDMYLSTPRYLAFIGLFFCWHQKTPAKIFPATCFAENGYFSKRLNFTRLFFFGRVIWNDKAGGKNRGSVRSSCLPLLPATWRQLVDMVWRSGHFMVVETHMWSYWSQNNDDTYKYTYFSTFSS